MSPAASTRWCPTPEQLMILEEMYRGGIKTPNATQIQQITAHLSLYGKIEGKNVFYWFQNHKARDRQKLRRKLCRQQQQQLQLHFPPPAYLTYHPHQLLNAFDASSSLNGFHPSFYAYNPLQWLPREGLVQEASTPTQIMDCTSKMETTQEKWMCNMYDDQNYPTTPTSLCASLTNNRPLKTLQLFPIKDESNSSTTTNNHYEA